MKSRRWRGSCSRGCTSCWFSVGARRSRRARVRLTIEDILDDGLPRAYTKELFKSKSDALFEHVYEAYVGEGKSVYSAVG